MTRTALASVYATCASLVMLISGDTTVHGIGAATVTVSSGGDLQAAINSAQPGDTILLPPGSTFVGNFVLPAKSGSGVITIRSAAPDSTLPGTGVQIDPSYAPQLPKLQSPNSAPALSTAPGAHDYTVRFLEFLPNSGGLYDIIELGDGSSAQNTQTLVPHDLVIDACYIHGDPTYGQKRGIALNSASTTVSNSYIAEIKADGQDSQAIAGWNGPGPFTITNDYLEAAGENLLFGGADPSIPSLIPADITIQHNHLAKQPIWQTQGNWSVKNLLELKNAQRVTIVGNLLEYDWLEAQTGYAVLFTPRNQGGNCPWCVVQHVQLTNNRVQHVASGINILGTDNDQTSGIANDLAIRNNLFEDVSSANWGGDGRFMLVGGGGANIIVDHNTVLQDGLSVLYAYGAPMPSFVFTNNIVPDYSWAVMGDSASPGNGTIATYFPGSQFLGNVFAGSDPLLYPAGNFYPSALSAVGFVDLAIGNYRLSATSPYYRNGTDHLDVGCNIDALDTALGVLPPTRPLNLHFH